MHTNTITTDFGGLRIGSDGTATNNHHHHHPTTRARTLCGCGSKDNDKRAKRNSQKSQWPMPEKKVYILETRPKEADVIFGRRGRFDLHPGNKAYWLQVLQERRAYRLHGAARNTKEQTEIATRILDLVQQANGGRFLQLDEQTNGWFVVPRRMALAKTKQALGGMRAPKWAAEQGGIADQEGHREAGAGARARNRSPHQTAEFLRGVVFSLAAANLSAAERDGDGLLAGEQLPAAATTKAGDGFWETMFMDALSPVAVCQ